MESPRRPFRGHLPLAYTGPRPQGQPGGIAGWGVSGRAGRGSDPRTSPAGRGQGPEGPSSLPPLWQSLASWAGWTGFCGCPGWGHLPVGASQGPGAGNLACLSPRVVRSMTCLPTPRYRSCHAASHQGSGRAVTGTRLSCEASSPPPAVCPIPETSRHLVLAWMLPLHMRFPASPQAQVARCPPGLPRRHAVLPRQLGDESGPALCSHLHRARDPEAGQWGTAHSRHQGPGCSVGNQKDAPAEAGR